MSHNKTDSRREWAAMWPIPITGMLGVVACSAFSYSYGIYMLALTDEFGWTRGQFGSAFLLQAIVGLIVGPIVGRLVDRFGPRRLALWGLIPYAAGMSVLSLATGSIWQWTVLCGIYSAGISVISTTVWVATVSRTFDAGRGLAMGVVLAGTGVGTGLWPLVATGAISLVGWRMSLPLIALTSVVVLWPLVYAFVRDSRDPQAQTTTPVVDRPPLWPILRSRTFIFLVLAGAIFVSVSYGLTLHLVPMLTGNGFSPTLAASAAVVAGVTTVLGRVVTGWLLDRLPTRVVGTCAFMLPAIEVVFLWQGDGSIAMSLVGVALLGLSTGAESDVLVYIASRRFPRVVFGSVYSIISASFSCAAGSGPLIAGIVFDKTGNYSAYYLICIPMALIATVLVAAIPNKPVAVAPVTPAPAATA